MTRRGACAAAFLALAGLLSGCGLFGTGNSGGRTTLEFFQFKPEAVGTFNKIIADFEKAYPTIRVRQNHVPDADTAIRTRLVRDAVPDVMTLNANATFGELAKAGAFYDFSKEPVTQSVSPAILSIINDLGTRAAGEVNGLPFANNADGVIYNKDLFARYGVKEPTTWGELLAAARTFKDAGVTPFYVTLKDAWTSLPAFNALASNLPPRNFFDSRESGRTTFAAAYPEVAARLSQLFQFGQQDRFSRGYNDGNQAFAKGEAAMYLQGIWAIPPIRTFKPTFQIGTFALPVDDPAATRLVSGVDVAVALGRKPRHPTEAMTFVNYLMRPDVVSAYAADQSAIPTLKGTVPSDPALVGLVPYFQQGRLVGFTDHHIPPAIPLAPINQQYLIDGDRSVYLKTLDSEWDKVARRRR
ncbi:MAG TPA: extracellular solute-binding protein [Planosporangium sp.]|jgi:raffinose/stachyose/melibiose transport system substrate-binding protein|nr:extracellular solute-binding protein [Planosporangium sp.]